MEEKEMDRAIKLYEEELERAKKRRVAKCPNCNKELERPVRVTVKCSEGDREINFVASTICYVCYTTGIWYPAWPLKEE